MKILHKLAHVLDIYSSFHNVYVDNGYVCMGRTCNTCGETEMVRKMWLEKDTPNIMKIINGDKT